MRPPRLRLRTLMIIVAALALALGVAAWIERLRRPSMVATGQAGHTSLFRIRKD